MSLAVKTNSEEGKQDFLVNPPENLFLQEGSVVIVMGDVEEIRRAREEAKHGQHSRVANALSS